jgi:hypothetical protein
MARKLYPLVVITYLSLESSVVFKVTREAVYEKLFLLVLIHGVSKKANSDVAWNNLPVLNDLIDCSSKNKIEYHGSGAMEREMFNSKRTHLAVGRAWGGHLLTKKISSTKVNKTKVLYNVGALGTLAGTWTSQNKDNGRLQQS